MKFTIDRKKWLRGEEDSKLRRASDGKMCCMGQACEQLGVPLTELTGLKTVSSLADPPTPLASKKLGWDPDWVFEGYQINDDTTIDDATREQKLSALFAGNRHEVTFVG